MAESIHAASRESTTDSKFYIPAGGGPSFVVDRVEGIWASLFDHQVGPLN